MASNHQLWAPQGLRLSSIEALSNNSNRFHLQARISEDSTALLSICLLLEAPSISMIHLVWTPISQPKSLLYSAYNLLVSQQTLSTLRFLQQRRCSITQSTYIRLQILIWSPLQLLHQLTSRVLSAKLNRALCVLPTNPTNGLLSISSTWTPSRQMRTRLFFLTSYPSLLQPRVLSSSQTTSSSSKLLCVTLKSIALPSSTI